MPYYKNEDGYGYLYCKFTGMQVLGVGCVSCRDYIKICSKENYTLCKRDDISDVPESLKKYHPDYWYGGFVPVDSYQQPYTEALKARIKELNEEVAKLKARPSYHAVQERCQKLSEKNVGLDRQLVSEQKTYREMAIRNGKEIAVLRKENSDLKRKLLARLKDINLVLEDLIVKHDTEKP